MGKSFSYYPFIRSILFGNYFYGLCAVALSLEASVQQKFPLNHYLYYAAVFCTTVVYYTRAYITDSSGYPSDERNAWYIQNKSLIAWSQIVLSCIALSILIMFLYTHHGSLRHLNRLQILLLALFPLVSALYYGAGPRFNIRRIGSLKPFIIGFAWAGLVTFYPVLFFVLHYQLEFSLSVLSLLLFLKNFMFISVLCIMFDIKDYAPDAQQNLNTFIVKAGLRRTIFFIIFPLCLIGLGTFVAYGAYSHFHPLKISLNVLPFALLIWVAYSLHQRRGLLYYLFVVDGLMLVKAFCGIAAMIFFS